MNKFLREIFPRLIILITLLANIFFVYFIYKKVVSIFSSTEESFVLKKEVTTYQLKTDLFEKIIERLKNKKNIEEETDLESFKNPFGFGSLKEAEIIQ